MKDWPFVLNTLSQCLFTGGPYERLAFCAKYVILKHK